MVADNLTTRWFERLQQVSAATVATTFNHSTLPLDLAMTEFRRVVKSRADYLGRIILFGNGGSLAIASHIATDFGLAGWPSIALTDPIAITSHTNDFGPAANFAKQLELLRPSYYDILIGMSCSGKSQNVIEALRYGKDVGNYVVTLSGFGADNPMRLLGDLNFYVPSSSYGFVQLAHESILHSACDIANGWQP